MQRPRGERIYGEGRQENSSSWLEHELGSKDWDEAEEGKRSQTVQGERGARQCRGASEPMEDHILRHWILSRGTG